MSQSTVARRYATALYEEADRLGAVEAVDDDVTLLRESLSENRELSRFFESPVIPNDKKEAVIQSLLEDRVADLTLNFLRLLVQKDREMIVPSILDRYRELRDEQRGIIDVHVRVAKPLSGDDRSSLADTLEEKTGRTVRLHVDEDPELIGGIVLRIGDRVFDGSVRNKLSTLRERMHEARLDTPRSANGHTNDSTA
jgi:F-type H+-transporting ATPase subunit delta